MERMQEKIAHIKGIKKKVTKWSMKKGLKGNFRRQNRLESINYLFTKNICMSAHVHTHTHTSAKPVSHCLEGGVSQISCSSTSCEKH